MAKNKPQADQQAQDETGAQAEAQTQATPKAQKVAVVRKLTVRDLCGKVDVSTLPEDGGEVELCKMAGFATGVKRGSTQYGEWAGLSGQFAGTNMNTGEVSMGSVAIIPGAMGDALVTATEAKLKEDAAAQIRFAVMVSVKRSNREPKTKYEYVIRPILEAELSSPALLLLESVK